MTRIGIISQSPTLDTGFGVTTKMIAEGLFKNGYHVVCFGLDQVGETFDRDNYKFKIWAVGKTDIFKSIELFLETENLDTIIINFDIVNLGRYYQIVRKAGFTKKLLGHLVLDGTPFLYGDLNFLNDFSQIIVPTKHSLNYLADEHKLTNIIYAPHGVNHDYFVPLKDKEIFKKKNNLEGKLIIGCFGRNTERKQQSKVLEAIKVLRENYKLNNLIAYFHCDPVDTLASWNLFDVAKYLKVEDIVYFKSNLKKQNDYSNTIFSELTLSEKIGICDVCINVPFCGGFELHNIEVQSCGVPLITTNDCGNISEVVNGSAILLDAEHVGIWRTGAKQYFVSPSLIADKIYELLNDNNLYNQVTKKGLENVKKYNWEYLQTEIVNSIVNN